MKSIKKTKIKNLCKRYAKSKSGTTLVELICVVTILSIVSSAGIGGMFGMVKVAKTGQNVSAAERSCALLTDQLAIYGNTSYNVKSIDDLNSADMDAYDPASSNGYYYDGTTTTDENFVDYFISATDKPNTLLIRKFDATDPTHPKNISTIENIEYISFRISSFKLPSNSGADVIKYALNYEIKTIYNYSISGAIVLNNVEDYTGVNISGDASGNFKIGTFGNDGYDAGKNPALNIRSTNREKVDRT